MPPTRSSAACGRHAGTPSPPSSPNPPTSSWSPAAPNARPSSRRTPPAACTTSASRSPSAGPAPDTRHLPLSLTIGKWLLAEHGATQAAWWGIASDAPPAECLQLGEKLAALAPRVALLAMGDGPARRARAAPHAADPEADRYDDQVAAALAAADPAALAALDPREDRPLEIAGRAAWQVLAGAAGDEQGRDAFDAELRYRGAPFEVSYVVASWRRKP